MYLISAYFMKLKNEILFICAVQKAFEVKLLKIID